MNKRLLSGLMILALMFTLVSTQKTVAFAEEGAASTYTVAKGDCLYAIARSVLGDGKRWNEIFELNRDAIKDPNLIHSGQVLALPGTATIDNAEGAEQALASDAEGAEQALASDTESAAAPAEEAVTAATQEEEATANQLAKNLIAKAKAEESTVTALLKEMENENVRLVGLDFNIKSEESLTRKIISDSHDKEVSLEEAAAAIADVLRYTLCTSTDIYVGTVDSTLKKLTGSGMQVVALKNTWGSDAYKGINTKMATANGFVFELQFHTEESYETKETTHKYYEIARAEDKTQEERDQAQAIANAEFAKIPIPEGAPDYQWKE